MSAADPQEQMARERGVTYVKLDGDVGILGNGAGLVMSHARRRRPGRRLARELPRRRRRRPGRRDRRAPWRSSSPTPRCEAVLFNIFGGITRCDEVARGILDALEQLDVGVPIVVRLDGTNDEEGRKLLHEAAPPGLHVERTMLDAAERVVELAGSRLASMADPRDRRDATRGAGHHGPRGPLPHAAQPRLRHARSSPASRPARAGRTSTASRSSTPSRDAVARDRRQHLDGLRAAALRRRRDLRGGRRRASTPSSASPRASRPTTCSASTPTCGRAASRLLGPNCPGALSPGIANVGIIPAQVFARGGVGLVSRSGTLTYQIGAELARLGVGNSTIVGIGGDPVVGTSFIDVLELFQADPATELIVMVGEIGGNEEEKAAAFIAEHVTKPVVAYIAGFTAPPGKTMGHAGAIISGSSGTAAGQEGGARGAAASASARTRPRRPRSPSKSCAAERCALPRSQPQSRCSHCPARRSRMSRTFA